MAELFAGVGGFRLGLEKAGWDVLWSNQWEPGTTVQHASRIYESHFNTGIHINDDVARVIERGRAGELEIPDIDLLCGGFPCQDYSVAKPLPQASGIEGKKGVLWWEIYRFLELRQPRYVLLENVDRLLKSPAKRRGRDFAIILACLADLGYWAEWRVVNAAEYGFPQKRRRVFILAYRTQAPSDPLVWLLRRGTLATALPVEAEHQSPPSLLEEAPHLTINQELHELSETFGEAAASPFANAGIAIKGEVWTKRVQAKHRGVFARLGDVLLDHDDVPAEYFIPESELPKWRYLKGAKSERRRHKSGHEYLYQEGAIPFPDLADEPSRTILTGEGGRTPSRFKHVVEAGDSRYRRLTPVELERLNGFPDGWTNGIPDGRRAFLMGNALVVGLVERIGSALRKYDRRTGAGQGTQTQPGD